VLDLMWTPVDVRFKEVLQTLKRQQQLVHDELTILQAKAANDAEAAAKHERVLAAEERRIAEAERQKTLQILQQADEIKGVLKDERKGMLICKSLRCYHS
jgi:hypothetical protein